MKAGGQPNLGSYLLDSSLQMGNIIHSTVEFKVLESGEVIVEEGLVTNDTDSAPNRYRTISKLKTSYPDAAR
jgi:hypothetical protein